MVRIKLQKKKGMLRIGLNRAQQKDPGRNPMDYRLLIINMLKRIKSERMLKRIYLMLVVMTKE